MYVADVTEFITTNGPSGPGDLKKLDKVVAGTDRVAVDAFCCRYLCDLVPTSAALGDMKRVDFPRVAEGEEALMRIARAWIHP